MKHKAKTSKTYVVLASKRKNGKITAYTLCDWCKHFDRNYNTVISRINRAEVGSMETSVIFIREDSELLGPANKNTLVPLHGSFHDKAHGGLSSVELGRIGKEQKADAR